MIEAEGFLVCHGEEAIFGTVFFPPLLGHEFVREQLITGGHKPSIFSCLIERIVSYCSHASRHGGYSG